jgi:hypothetical protein
MASDEQVGNASVSTMTPGSAVAGQLQNILTSQRLEKRQAMLDALNQQNVQSEISARNENAKSLAENRTEQASNRAARELATRASLYSPHQALAPTDESYLQKNAPSLVDPSQPGTAPLGPDEAGPSMPATPAQFHGLPVQLAAEKKTASQATAMDKLRNMSPVDEAQMSDLQRELLFREATGASVPEAVLRPKVGGRVLAFNPATATLIDTATGKPAGSKQPNDVVENMGRAPVGPATPAPTYWEGTGPNGEKQIFREGRGPTEAPTRVNFPAGFVVGGRAGVDKGPGATKPSQVKDATWKEWINVNNAYAGNPTSPQAEEALTRQANKVISESSNSPVVKGFLAAAWNKTMPDGSHPARTLSYDDLITRMHPDSTPLKDSEKSEISTIWNNLKKNQ